MIVIDAGNPQAVAEFKSNADSRSPWRPIPNAFLNRYATERIPDRHFPRRKDHLLDDWLCLPEQPNERQPSRVNSPSYRQSISRRRVISGMHEHRVTLRDVIDTHDIPLRPARSTGRARRRCKHAPAVGTSRRTGL